MLQLRVQRHGSVLRKKKTAKSFLSKLEKLVELAREKAELYGYEESPYDALISDFDEGMKQADYDKLYNPLKLELKNILSDVKDKQSTYKLEGDFDKKAQSDLTHKLIGELGFDFNNGAIAESSHPFSITMGSNDFRITTRYLRGRPHVLILLNSS